MRKVRIVTNLDSPRIFVTTSDYQDPINSAFSEIENAGGKIIKTEYLINRNGFLEGAVIEYESVG